METVTVRNFTVEAVKAAKNVHRICNKSDEKLSPLIKSMIGFKNPVKKSVV